MSSTGAFSLCPSLDPVQGVETLMDVSETQLEACAGGPILRAEGVYVGLNTKGLQRGSQMLLQALQQVEKTSPLETWRQTHTVGGSENIAYPHVLLQRLWIKTWNCRLAVSLVFLVASMRCH